MGLKDKTALITGGTKGIGRAICIALAKEGCKIISFGRDLDYVENLKGDLNALKIGAKYEIYCVDIMGDGGDSYIQAQGYGVDILINNIGGGGTWTDYEEVMQVNYSLMVQFTDFVLNSMLKNKWGRVITISSLYGREPHNNPYFSAAKAAQIAYMKSMSKKKEYVKNEITFNIICPGHISCGYSYKKNKGTKEFKSMVSDLSMGRIGTPEDVANVVKFLCSKESSYINGSSINVDGGQSVGF